MLAGTTLIVGGTKGLGRRLAERCVERGETVEITGRDTAITAPVGARLGSGT